MKRADTFSKKYSSQSAYELDGFIAFLRQQNVRSYLEIGARHGDTFHAVMSALPAGSLGVAVDLPGGLWGKESSKQQLKLAVEDLRAKGYTIHCLFGDSQSAEMRARVAEFAPFDAVFIDGDHTLAGVTRDWYNYREMAPMIGFHDIVGTGQRENRTKHAVDVPILWQKIKQEVIEAGGGVSEWIEEQSSMGIGVCLR